MNLKQRTILLLGAIVISLMCLYPPWNYIYKSNPSGRTGIVYSVRPAGYHFINAPPYPHMTEADAAALARLFDINSNIVPYDELTRFSPEVDTTRLLIQCLVVTLLTGVLAVILKTRQAN